MACDELNNSSKIRNIVEYFLTVGNVFNAGYKRGEQADGFEPTIFENFKHIKNYNKSISLLE